MRCNALFLLLFASGFASAEIVVSQVNEDYSDSVKVSGEFLVGLQLSSEASPRSLHVLFPRDATGGLCIQLSSIDGKYKALIEHKIKTPVNGLERIVFESKYENRLRTYGKHEIAVSASLATSCDPGMHSKKLIASWSDKLSNELLLLIRSSARKDVAQVSGHAGFSGEAKCKKFRKSYNVSYDKYCLMNVDDLSQIDAIEVVRKNLQPIEAETFELW